MCLYKQKIKHSYKCETIDGQTIDGQTIDGQTMIPVWKVLCRYNHSPAIPFIWNKGWNVSSRSSVKLNRTERMYNDIVTGFHFFLTKKGATLYVQALKQEYQYHDPLFIHKMYVHKKDIVKRGLTELSFYSNSPRDHVSIPSLVATQAYWKGI